jgi:hypothetical protein
MAWIWFISSDGVNMYREICNDESRIAKPNSVKKKKKYIYTIFGDMLCTQNYVLTAENL